MSDTISLVGLDKAEVFAALYNGARAQGLGFLHYDATPMTADQARKRFGDNWDYFDYVDGRVMKVSLSGDELNPRLYDRDNGPGAAETIVNALRSTQDTNPEEAELIHKEGTRNAAILMNEHLYDEAHIKQTDDVVEFTLTAANFADELQSRLNDILNEDDTD